MSVSAVCLVESHVLKSFKVLHVFFFVFFMLQILFLSYLFRESLKMNMRKKLFLDKLYISLNLYRVCLTMQYCYNNSVPFNFGFTMNPKIQIEEKLCFYCRYKGSVTN